MKMKQALSLLLALALSPAAFANTPPVPAQEMAAENLLPNPGFENGSYGWTASGGATKTANAAAKGAGSFGFDWDSNASAQTLLSSLVAIPNGLKGKQGVAYCNIKAVSGSPTHTITINDGTNDLALAQTIQTTTSTFTRNAVYFTFPSSGSVRIKFASVASDEPEIYVDSCYLGDAFLFMPSVSQASLLGTLNITGCAGNWSASNGGFADFSANTSCTYTATGAAQAPATQIPAIKFASLAPGTYILITNGGFLTSTGSVVSWRFFDGTNGSLETDVLASPSSTIYYPGVTAQSFTYTTTQSNVTFSLQGKGSNTIVYGTQFTIKVLYFPSQTVQGYRQDATPASIAMAINASGTTASASFADPSTTTPTVTTSTSRNMSAVGATSLLGASVNFPRTGNYLVCYAGYISDSNASTIAGELTDGANAVVVGAQQGFAAVGAGSIPLGSCGNYNVTSVGSPTTFKLKCQTNTGTATCVLSTMSIVQLDSPLPSPILTGGVTSNASSNSERIERLSFGGASNPSYCSSTPCTIYSQSGSWVSSITRNTTGNYTVNFSSAWASVPTCVATPLAQFSDSMLHINSPSTSSITLSSYNDGGAAADTGVNIICMGPR